MSDNIGKPYRVYYGEGSRTRSGANLVESYSTFDEALKGVFQAATRDTMGIDSHYYLVFSGNNINYLPGVDVGRYALIDISTRLLQRTLEFGDKFGEVIPGWLL